MDDALAMCRIAWDDGIQTIVATPHCYRGRYENDAATIRPVYDLLKQRLQEEAIGLNLLMAGDIHVDPDIVAFLEDNPELCPGGHFVLIELPSEAVPPFVGNHFTALRFRGFTPILTHPERNRMIRQRPDLVGEWVRQGVFVQVTAMSLTGEFGDAAQTAALTLLDSGRIHFVATDAHSPTRRRPVLSGAAVLLRKRIGEKGTRRLLEENPRRMLAGLDPLEVGLGILRNSAISAINQ
ncbi:MAG: hypothetical protein M0Q23_08000 [Syntrophales bacterium]|jgi:protein-tyrosine phosphatase|nr:hypothetical protein [Syntrophales bacterium]MCK9528566.1 hypothetical protein [Syntrophales bacterium]